MIFNALDAFIFVVIIFVISIVGNVITVLVSSLAHFHYQHLTALS